MKPAYDVNYTHISVFPPKILGEKYCPWVNPHATHSHFPMH